MSKTQWDALQREAEEKVRGARAARARLAETTQVVDFDVLIRSVLDARSSTVSRRNVTEIGFATACYLAQRGVRIMLDGQPFEPGTLSLHKGVRLIEDRGLFEEETK